MYRGTALPGNRGGQARDFSHELVDELCLNSNASIASVKECVENIIAFVENDILKKFENFAERSTEYSEAVDAIKNDIETVGGFIKELNLSVEQISQSIGGVVTSTQENNSAIAVIVEKNETAAAIAETTQKQSEENKEIVKQLETLLSKFTV